MVDWNRAAAQLEKLAELRPKDYDKVMKPEDIRWIKHHLALASMNPAVDVVEFSKTFMGLEKQDDVTLADNPPTYAQIVPRVKQKRPTGYQRYVRGCFCLIQNYCDICQED